jgi:hypothetical protein
MSKWWDEPYTAEELAERPKTKPWDEVFADYCERTGEQIIPVVRVTPGKTLRREPPDPFTIRLIQRSWMEGASAENIHRACRLKGAPVSWDTIYELTRHLPRNGES